MKSKKKRMQIKRDVVKAIKILNKKSSPKNANISEKTGNSTTNKIMQMKIAEARYSSNVFFIPLLFKSFFNSEKSSKCGSKCLLK